MFNQTSNHTITNLALKPTELCRHQYDVTFCLCPNIILICPNFQCFDPNALPPPTAQRTGGGVLHRTAFQELDFYLNY